MFNITELTHTLVEKQIEKTKKKQNKLVEAFCSFLYSGEEDTDRYYIGNSEIGGVFCVGDSYFNVSDIELYMKLDTPEQVWKCYRDFTDYKSNDGLLNLAHYIDLVFLGEEEDEEDCDCEYCSQYDGLDYMSNEEDDCLCKDCDCGDEEEDILESTIQGFDDEDTLRKELHDDGVWVRTFIRDLNTGNELYSKWEGQFVQGENCFIDDTLHYCRLGGNEGYDYEIIKKPLNLSVLRGSKFNGKMIYKPIILLPKSHIRKILETQKLKPSLRKLFMLELEKRNA